MSDSLLQVERREAGIEIITLNHPQNLNALGVEISRDLTAALQAAAGETDLRVIVLRGAGRAFSSGGNLVEMREGIKNDAGRYMEELTAAVYTAIKTVMEINLPVIAQVHGFAYGAALNLVLACDLAVAADDTVFCESFVRLGLIPGGYATLLLPAAVGFKRTAELCLTAREISAAEALSLGLVTKIVPARQLEAETMKLAEAIAQASPLAVRETKRLLREARRRSPAEQAEDERRTQIRMAQTRDFREGIEAFFEKRKPRFEGR